MGGQSPRKAMSTGPGGRSRLPLTAVRAAFARSEAAAPVAGNEVHIAAVSVSLASQNAAFAEAEASNMGADNRKELFVRRRDRGGKEATPRIERTRAT